MNQQNSGTECQRGSIVGGIVLMVIGGFFLMVQMGWWPFVWDSWPVILIILGIVLLISGMRKKRTRPEESAP